MSNTAKKTPTAAPSLSALPLGHVAFVGTGPGDPDLLTVRAAEVIRNAEVVLTEAPEHDELVRLVLGVPSLTVTDEEGNQVPAPDVPEVVEVARSASGQPLTPSNRAKAVVKHAKSGRRVVRLISGDPFLYTCGPDEAQGCVKAGLSFEVVPGVAAALAVPAYAGIPLTTRHDREIAVISCASSKVDWEWYADDKTLVLLDALGSIGDIAAALVAAGRGPETPVAMTSTGTSTTQSTVVSTLETIAADAADAGLRTRVVELDIAVAGSSVHRDGYRGRAAFVVDEDRGVLVGVTFAGPDVAELLQAATIAVVGEVPLARLWHAVPAYPTVSEIWLRLLETYGRPGSTED